ncbi:uncharacterized protein LOC132190309 [Corylus avellana]|uniref:uncharacterized protein LOC132190309 n=1 Tax=Corylus avellana TaxID=13451 RepID=UPI00286B8B5C|nr:uncharacterized protein LOC132190309 [Corylus avellana]
MKLSREQDSLAMTAKKLGRDLAKVMEKKKAFLEKFQASRFFPIAIERPTLCDRAHYQTIATFQHFGPFVIRRKRSNLRSFGLKRAILGILEVLVVRLIAGELRLSALQAKTTSARHLRSSTQHNKIDNSPTIDHT